MHVTELYELTKWIDVEIVEKEILQKYQALHGILNANVQPNQPQQPFEDQKNVLIESLGNVPLHLLNIDQLEFLGKLTISQAVGEEGIKVLEDILFKNVIDIATSAAKVQEIIKGINYGTKKSNQIRDGLEDFVDLEEPEFDEVLIRVNFSGHAAMSNVTDFKDWGDVWYDIGRGIAMAHNTSPEDIKIIGAKKGSVIFELAVFYAIAQTMSMIILSALKVTERVYNIKMQAEKLRGLKLSNIKIVKELENEAENEKIKGIEDISKKLITKLKLKKNEGDKENAFDKAVKNLVDFTEKGGEIDFVMPEESEDKDEDEDVDKKQQQVIKQLRSSFEEIRLLEQKIKQIEHIPED